MSAIKKPRWTDEQDRTLLSIVNKARSEGKSAQEGIRKAASVLGRSPETCAFRYYNKKNVVIEQQPIKQNDPLASLHESLATIETEYNRLLAENEKLRNENEELRNDKETFLQIFETARKLTMNVEDRPKFKMDSNGNLERLS